MTPGTYNIPSPVQRDLLDLARTIKGYANRPHTQQGILMIAEKMEMLGSYDFSHGNELFLMKPDFTFGYVRMGCDMLMNEMDDTPQPVFNCAERVRVWLDSIGHQYPTRS
jgi:hypothetical protein